MTPTEAIALLRAVPACPSDARANMGWCERHREQYCRYTALDCASECADCAALLVEAVRADAVRERDDLLRRAGGALLAVFDPWNIERNPAPADAAEAVEVLIMLYEGGYVDGEDEDADLLRRGLAEYRSRRGKRLTP